MKSMTAHAGQRTRVFRRFSSSLRQQISLEFQPVDGSSSVSGTLEVHGSRWLFPKPVETHRLQSQMTVTKGFWDTRYAIYVTPKDDTRVTIGRPKLG
jgi:hypothetical protein